MRPWSQSWKAVPPRAANRQVVKSRRWLLRVRSNFDDEGPALGKQGDLGSEKFRCRMVSACDAQLAVGDCGSNCRGKQHLIAEHNRYLFIGRAGK